MASTSHGFALLARAGYAARGVVYVLLGLLALSGVFGGLPVSGETDTEGAFALLLSQPFGRIVLMLVGFGLVGHVLWRLAQSLLDCEGRGNDPKHLVARGGMLVSGLINAALAVAAFRMAARAGGSEDGPSFAEQVLSLPFGNVLLVLGGLVVIGAGAISVWRVLSGRFLDRIDVRGPHARALERLGGVGLAARGLLLAAVGVLVVLAGFRLEAAEATDLADALDAIAALPLGNLLYIGAAFGLLAFAAYCFIEARFRRVLAPSLDKAVASLTPG